MVFQCINIRQVPWEVLKTAAFGPGFQHLPRDLANVNAWKTMFDPYNKIKPRVWRTNKLFTIWNPQYVVSEPNSERFGVDYLSTDPKLLTNLLYCCCPRGYRWPLK